MISTTVFGQWRTKFSSGSGYNSRKSLTVGGYLKSANYFRYTDWNTDRVAENILHSNLRFDWKLNSQSSFYMSIHNRYFFGESIQNEESEYANSLKNSNNYIDMNWVFVEGNKSLLHTAVDRLYYQFSGKRAILRVGKQRIDWSQTLIWNPNNFFNTYSFLNFDYETRSGIDAVYGSFNLDRRGNSSVQIGYAPQSLVEESIFAARYRYKKGNAEWQLMAGQVQEDYALGFGWTTKIRATGFSGEISYYKDKNDESDKDVFIGTLATYYKFKSNLTMHYELNYNSNPQNTEENYYSIFYQPLSSKYITFNKYSFGVLGQYPLNKYWTVGATGIAYLDTERYYVGAYTKLTLPSKLSFLVSTQLMDEDNEGIFGAGKKYLFSRIMWSF